MEKPLLIKIGLFPIVLLASTLATGAGNGTKITPTPTLSIYDEIKEPCYKDPRIAGEKFSFSGRAYLGANLTSLKISMIRTRRILGVIDMSSLPNNLETIFKKNLNAEVYGTFTVYPLTPYKKGVRQFVCVDSVTITKIVDRK